MTRARAIVLGVAGALVHGLLLAGGAAALPVPVRVGLAFAVLVLGPGWALLALSGGMAGPAWPGASWAFGFGVAWVALLLMITQLLHVPFLALSAGLLVLNALLWGLVAALGGGPRRERAPMPRWALAAILLAAAVLAWHVGVVGPPMGYGADTPDHIGTLRRMLQTGALFPDDAFFRDAGRLGADPRKGLWHGVLALVTRLAAADPIDAWRWLGVMIAPFFVLTFAALGFLCRGPAGAALAAWLLIVTYGGGLSNSLIRQMVFASRLADLLALATIVAVLADLRERARATRWAAAALGFAAISTHVFTAIQFAIVFPALGVGLLVRDRRWGPDLRRLAGTALLLAAASLPYLVWRTGQSYAPTNVIHTEPQGLTYVFGSWRVVSLATLYEWMGRGWLLLPLLWVAVWRRGRANAATLSLLTSSLAVVLIIYDPPMVALLQPRFGYLLMRMIWIVPWTVLLAWWIPELARALFASGPRSPRIAALAQLALVAWVLVSPARAAVDVLLHPRIVLRDAPDVVPAHGIEAFRWMTRHLPPGTVVLSDPATSYLVPMRTPFYVMTLMDQHSSPNDSLALTRLLDARDALDPYGSWPRTRAVIHRYGVSAIVLNGAFRVPIGSYWTPSAPWFAAARARLDGAPAAFERVADFGDVVVYRVHPAALDTLSGEARPRPFVRPAAPADTSLFAPALPGLPAIAGWSLRPHVAQPGDTLRGSVEWRPREPLPAGSYSVAVRFDQALPVAWKPPRFLMKPYRKMLEGGWHERYRFRTDHMPVGGAYGVDLWRPGEIVTDGFVVVVPGDIAAGTYVVRVRMIRAPIYPNFRLADWFFDEDYYAGQLVDTVRIRKGGAAAAKR